MPDRAGQSTSVLLATGGTWRELFQKMMDDISLSEAVERMPLKRSLAAVITRGERRTSRSSVLDKLN